MRNIMHVKSPNRGMSLATIYGGWGLAPIYNSVNLISHFLDNFLQLSNMADPVPVK